MQLVSECSICAGNLGITDFPEERIVRCAHYEGRSITLIESVKGWAVQVWDEVDLDDDSSDLVKATEQEARQRFDALEAELLGG